MITIQAAVEGQIWQVDLGSWLEEGSDKPNQIKGQRPCYIQRICGGMSHVIPISHHITKYTYAIPIMLPGSRQTSYLRCDEIQRVSNSKLISYRYTTDQNTQNMIFDMVYNYFAGSRNSTAGNNYALRQIQKSIRQLSDRQNELEDILRQNNNINTSSQMGRVITEIAASDLAPDIEQSEEQAVDDGANKKEKSNKSLPIKRKNKKLGIWKDKARCFTTRDAQEVRKEIMLDGVEKVMDKLHIECVNENKFKTYVEECAEGKYPIFCVYASKPVPMDRSRFPKNPLAHIKMSYNYSSLARSMTKAEKQKFIELSDQYGYRSAMLYFGINLQAPGKLYKKILL